MGQEVHQLLFKVKTLAVHTDTKLISKVENMILGESGIMLRIVQAIFITIYINTENKFIIYFEVCI